MLSAHDAVRLTALIVAAKIEDQEREVQVEEKVHRHVRTRPACRYGLLIVLICSSLEVWLFCLPKRRTQKNQRTECVTKL